MRTYARAAGTDGHIWGGEFLRSPARQGAQRVAHFAYFDALLGDKMPREPRLSAFSLARHLSVRLIWRPLAALALRCMNLTKR
ncbi:hypothetical protein QMK33_20755 [Hymenobacter sp. H14-R3]|uniref:Kae1-like domain-containing protein n=1 Tax=Hymenobacter sp. H14-R3 TaxID=3046308 RepID=UPI0024BB26E6|nr:hypothetical protein [Hymenobacter sp. H14-R3]MDJ0367584.1 hypothetical protein [Hymenobacter sp. H14-R3]